MKPFETFFENLTLPCCVIDNRGQVTAWNKALAKASGISKRKAIGKSLDSLGEFATELHDQWRCLAENQPVKPIAIGEFSYIPAFSPVSKTTWSIVLESKQALSIRGKRSDLISTVSHDLKSPLSAMRGYISLIENFGALNERQKQYTNRLYTSIDEMLEMIENLLNMAMVDSGMKLELGEVNLAHVAQHIANKYVELAESHRIELRQNLESVPLVQGDERRLKQVVENLISNAIKYSPDGGQVIVSVKAENDTVLLSVQDTGIGIAPEHLDHVFKRFYRINNDKTHRIKGTGLGLAISFDIIKQHGSALKVESTVGEGSRFYFNLPIPE